MCIRDSSSSLCSNPSVTRTQTKIILALILVNLCLFTYYGVTQRARATRMPSKQYPYWGTIVRVHNGFGRCLVTIQRDGVQMERELRLVTRGCRHIEAGAMVQVVSDEGWNVRIPSMLP